ncbi:aminoglycoside phosphotransferase family protein [Streptomyces sp. NBC_00102]|uniref:aminoglycoside phosphotransferase family protein n=1 Tax=Streptomyces sp. NBC_00102 TaxID=2975652 RepID=UPI002256CA64|nr:aminoglycoside phosphotransferase family protein [Streptomyces sp. NBC_00102]MCX5399772.1 aminoglycoside phosphotransferase family protein [Streptomyces sp. NBC_00102]
MRRRIPLNEELLSAVGVPERAELLDSSPRSRVWRVRLTDRRLVVVKQIIDGGDAGADADARFARELAGLRLAARAVGPAVAPAVLAADPLARVMVLEHVDDLGKTDDWLPGYAESLARLHALTGPADAGTLPAWSGPTAADAESFLALARALDVPVPSAVHRELDDLLQRLDPTLHHALLHGDPCPGNDLRTAEGVRFVDFERAALGNGLVELAYVRIGFPTCWCAMSVTGHPLAEAESVYRTTWRDLTGKDVPGDLADACAGWLIQGDALVERAHRGTADQLARVAVEDFEWGYVSARERLVHRLGAVAGMSRDHDHLHALGRLGSAMADRLLAHRPPPRPLPGQAVRPW